MSKLVQDFDAPERGCGFRKQGGFYFYATGQVIDSGFFSKPLKCACGIQHTRMSRNVQSIIPTDLFPILKTKPGELPAYPSLVFEEGEVAYVGTIDSKNYPTVSSFMDEANQLGVSRRLPNGMPKGFKPGQRFFLIHKNGHTLPDGSTEPGFFMCCTPIVQYVVKGDEDEEFLSNLVKKGIQPIRVANSVPQ